MGALRSSPLVKGVPRHQPSRTADRAGVPSPFVQEQQHGTTPMQRHERARRMEGATPRTRNLALFHIAGMSAENAEPQAV